MGVLRVDICAEYGVDIPSSSKSEGYGLAGAMERFKATQGYRSTTRARAHRMSQPCFPNVRNNIFTAHQVVHLITRDRAPIVESQLRTIQYKLYNQMETSDEKGWVFHIGQTYV